MEIKVLGPGCVNREKMVEMAKKAVKELGIDAKIEKVSDIQEIMKYTMSTPGLWSMESSSILENHCLHWRK